MLQATESAWPVHPAARPSPIVAWPGPQFPAESARKVRKLRGYGSIWSKDASLAIRRDGESFSVRHRTAAHKARQIGASQFEQHYLDGQIACTVALLRSAPTLQVPLDVEGLGQAASIWICLWIASSCRLRTLGARQSDRQSYCRHDGDDSNRPAQAEVRTLKWRTQCTACVSLFAGCDQNVKRSLGGRGWSGIISVAHAGRLPGLEEHADSGLIADFHEALKSNHVHDVRRDVVSDKKIRSDHAGDSSGCAHFEFPIRFGDFLRLGAELAVGQLQLRLLCACVVLDDFHGGFRTHVQHRAVVESNSRARIRLGVDQVQPIHDGFWRGGDGFRSAGNAYCGDKTGDFPGALSGPLRRCQSVRR